MRNWAWYGIALAWGGFLYIICGWAPVNMPVWLPWEFSWPIYLATVLTLF